MASVWWTCASRRRRTSPARSGAARSKEEKEGLRARLDVVVGSLDEPTVDGRTLAQRANFSRDHLDRLVAGATGESPVALRRRLLLERAAWELRAQARTPSQAAGAAGYGSLAAFSRAFARAHGVPPGAFARSGRPVALAAPNGIHFHPPAGLMLPGARGAAGGHDPALRLLAHHVAHARELLRAARDLPAAALERPLRPRLVVVWFEGEEPTAALMAERLVGTLEVWAAAVDGRLRPAVPPGGGDRLARFDAAAGELSRRFTAIRARGAWDDAFVDGLCEPPESFTYGGVLAHVLEFGAVRRHALAGVLRELGVEVAAVGDPLARRR